jgi:hemerythrin-like domain-containing protein
MRPTDILMQEHRVIEQVLDCLEAMASFVESNAELNQQDAKSAIDFFRNFADRCHHGKEEDCLFPLLEKKGFSREQGPTGVMVQEHETGRLQVRGMEVALNAVEAGNAAATADYVTHARAFITLLREHIQKEDHCLFQMADKALDEGEQSQLIEAFNHAEHDMGAGTHEKYIDVAANLAKKHGIQTHATDAAAGSDCCGHHSLHQLRP